MASKAAYSTLCFNQQVTHHWAKLKLPKWKGQSHTNFPVHLHHAQEKTSHYHSHRGLRSHSTIPKPMCLHHMSGDHHPNPGTGQIEPQSRPNWKPVWSHIPPKDPTVLVPRQYQSGLGKNINKVKTQAFWFERVNNHHLYLAIRAQNKDNDRDSECFHCCWTEVYDQVWSPTPTRWLCWPRHDERCRQPSSQKSSNISYVRSNESHPQQGHTLPTNSSPCWWITNQNALQFQHHQMLPQFPDSIHLRPDQGRLSCDTINSNDAKCHTARSA